MVCEVCLYGNGALVRYTYSAAGGGTVYEDRWICPECRVTLSEAFTNLGSGWQCCICGGRTDGSTISFAMVDRRFCIKCFLKKLKEINEKLDTAKNAEVMFELWKTRL